MNIYLMTIKTLVGVMFFDNYVGQVVKFLEQLNNQLYNLLNVIEPSFSDHLLQNI